MDRKPKKRTTVKRPKERILVTESFETKLAKAVGASPNTKIKVAGARDA